MSSVGRYQENQDGTVLLQNTLIFSIVIALKLSISSNLVLIDLWLDFSHKSQVLKWSQIHVDLKMTTLLPINCYYGICKNEAVLI